MKLILACLLFLLTELVIVSSASAATITWGSATTISGDTDVDNSGTLVLAYFWAIPNYLGNSVNVNGVTFDNYGSTDGSSMPAQVGPGITVSGFAHNWVNTALDYNGWQPYQSSPLSVNYCKVLDGMLWADGAANCTVTVLNLTPDQAYKVQIWCNDSRDATGSQPVTLSSAGGNSVTLNTNPSKTVGGVGQYSIGTFTADATTQSIGVYIADYLGINAIQVRTDDGGGGGTGVGPTLANNSVSSISATSATFNVTLTSTGTATTTTWLYWGTNNQTQTTENWLGGGSRNFGSANNSGATLSASVAGLSSSTTYYYAFCAVNLSGTNWATGSFTTLTPTTPGTITWGPATTISGDSDVDNSGTLVFAYCLHLTYASTVVNNVTFDKKGSDGTGEVPVLPNITTTGFTSQWDAMASAYALSLSANYRAVIDGTFYGNNPCSFTLENLTIGLGYKVQLWFDNSRDTGSPTVTITSGGNSVILTCNTTGVRGGVGQYTIGTFTAGATTQTITFVPSGSQVINAIQLRTWDGGTGPVNSAPEFKTIQAGTTSNLRFTWSASANPGVTNVFRIYRCTNLLAGGWQVVASNIASGGATNEWSDTNLFSRAFYRVASSSQ